MADKIKALLGTGLAVLCGHIKQINKKADEAGGAALTLAQVVSELMGKTTDSAVFTIAATGWTADTTVSGYTVRYDMNVEGLTAGDRVDVTVAPSSVATAQAAGFFPIVESAAGKFNIWAKNVPVTAISASYTIFKGGS